MLNDDTIQTSSPARFARAVSVVVAAILLLAVPASAQIVGILSDDFSLPSYSSGFVNGFDSSLNPDDQSSSTFTPIGVGGNPGDAGIVFHEHRVARDENLLPLNGDGNTFLQSIQVDQSTLWTPSIDGGIASLEFRLDVQLLAPVGSAAFEEIYFIVQDANGGSAAGFEPIVPASGWQTIVASGLVEADFHDRDFQGSLPLSFGFGFISGGDVTAEDETLAIDVDNFVVRAVTTPEPGTSGMLAVGVVSIGALARRRRTWTGWR